MNRLAACLALLLLPGLAAADVVELPDIGDHAAAVMSDQESRRLGESVMRSLSRTGRLLSDMEAEAYIKDLGYRLAAQGDARGQEFTFFMVKDDSINAFALPGGFVGIHTGLVMATRSEAELASVVAHEIAHVTQNHLARGLEKAGRMNMPLTAALIAAIVLGGENPEVAEAAIATAAAGSTQVQLDFTRAHEKEADRVGMQLLAGAGLDPSAMPSFFERLQEQSRYLSNAAPEFLRTHPITTSRISDSRNRATQLAKGAPQVGPTYDQIKAKLNATTNDDPRRLLQQTEASLETAPDDPTLAYRKALLLGRLGSHAEAVKILRRLVRSQPDRIGYSLALAEAEAAAGRLAEAAKTYVRLQTLYPGNAAVAVGHAEVLLDLGRAAEARDTLREVTRFPSSAPAHAYRLLAKSEAASGNQGASHIALARYYRQTGEPSSALMQLDLAKKENLDYYQRSQVEALEIEFKQELRRQADASHGR